MNRNLWSFAGCSLVVAVVVMVVWFRTSAEQVKVEKKQLVRHISYTLVVTNTSSALMEKADFSVLGPNSHTRSQRCNSIDADRDFIVHTDDLNNQILQFSLEKLAPFAVKVINIKADVTMQTSSPPVPLKNREQYLLNQPQLHLDNRGLLKKADKLLGKNDLETVTNSYNWITSEIDKTAYSEKERGALYALHKRSGDCTEFMHLFIALCRINRIPARGVSGYIVTQNKHLSPDELHDWAEVYIDGRWQLVDPYNGVFMEKEELYVVMRVHGDRQDGEFFHRWRTDDRRLHIAMKD
jgi:hypothetical protein